MERHPTEQRILDVAISIIETSGEASLRVHDIEVAAECTAPSIYHFFGSREGLVIAAQAERITRSFMEVDAAIEALLAPVSSRAELREAIHRILQLTYEPSRAIARLRRIFALGSVEGRPDLAAIVGDSARSYIARFARRIDRFQHEGWVDPDLDIDAFALWLSGQILGRVYVELGAEPAPHPAWDAISERAIAYIVFGSETD